MIIFSKHPAVCQLTQYIFHIPTHPSTCLVYYPKTRWSTYLLFFLKTCQVDDLLLCLELIPATTLKKIHPGFYWSKEVCKDALKQNSSMGCQVHPSWSPHPPLPYYYPLLPAMPSTRGPPLTSSWKSAFRFATTICQPSREAGRQATNRPAAQQLQMARQ